MEEIEIQTAPTVPTSFEQLSSTGRSVPSSASRGRSLELQRDDEIGEGQTISRFECADATVPPTLNSGGSSNCNTCFRDESHMRTSGAPVLACDTGGSSSDDTDSTGLPVDVAQKLGPSLRAGVSGGREGESNMDSSHLDRLWCSSHSSTGSSPVLSRRSSGPQTDSGHHPPPAKLSIANPKQQNSPKITTTTEPPTQLPDPTGTKQNKLTGGSPSSGGSSRPPAARLLSTFARLAKLASSPRHRGSSHHKHSAPTFQKNSPTESTQAASPTSSTRSQSPSASPTSGLKSAPDQLETMGNCMKRQQGESSSQASSKPPRFGLDSNKRDWIIENYKGSKQALKLEEAEMKHNVLIRDNESLNLEVSSKVNNVTIDNCKDVAVIVNSVVSTVEFIRCSKCSLQIMGTAPSISLDNCASITFYVSLESKGIQVVTSQISDVNMHFPENKENPDEWVEVPIPAQFVHSLKPGTNQLVSTVSELYR